ncbi:MAG: PhoX family protein [Candidatus Thiodiazotropha sp. (ex Ctena orbiculata)]|nr:PhoX family protein [Candidatus Thiodiazotropha taylori]
MINKTTLGFAIGLTLLTTHNAVADESMAMGVNGYQVSKPILTVGETISDTSGAFNPSVMGDYTPPGVLDGLGAYELDDETVRVFANHELLHFRGYGYEVSDGSGGSFSMTGARVSYIDIDKESKMIVDSGLAYNTIYDANGEVAKDISFLANDLSGFSRFCSAQLVEAGQFGKSRRGFKKGLEDTIFFTGEEDGGFFNAVGGAEWALDVETGDLWQVPDMGRGAWENITEIKTGNRKQVAFLLADDTSPFDFDGGEDEAAPLYLYVGEKDPEGDFLARNGLRGGKLYVWVSDTGETSPLDFNGKGSLKGTWVEIDNSPSGIPSEDGSTGYDEYGYPTQGNLWLQAKAVGAFGFSRPEDLATNPRNGREAVLASTGVDTFAVDPATGNGADTFGTVYKIKTNIKKLTAKLTILYDGDADPTRALRSPDNLEWADDGYIYVQEDEAEEDSLTGEPLFGEGAANPNEAGIVRLHPRKGKTMRVANIDRSVVLDGSIPVPSDAVDVDAGFAGEWESSGIVDVSDLFDEDEGTTFLFSVQAHGIEDQDQFNADSRIVDGDLVEGGQLLFLTRDDEEEEEDDDKDDDDNK